MRLLECNILCTNSKDQDLGLKEKNIWLPSVIDFNKVVAIKMNGHANDEIEDLSERAVVYIQNADYFIIDVDYSDVLEMWKQYLEEKYDKKQSKPSRDY